MNHLLPPDLLAALKACGLPWSLERGGKHLKIKVNGRLLGVLPHCGARHVYDRRPTLNLLTQLKYIIRTGEHYRR